MRYLKIKLLTLFQSILFTSFIINLGCSTSVLNTSIAMNEDQLHVIEIAKKIVEFEKSENSIINSSPIWNNSVYFIGLIELYKTSGDKSFFDDAYRWSIRNNWKIGGRKYHADDQSSAFVYLSIYEVHDHKIMINNTLTIFSQQLNDTTKHWWWADALFMAPPVMQYFQSLNLIDNEDYIFNQWKHTYDNLYSVEDSLFFRDKRYNNHVDDFGNKQFWLRGNGWVVAGLALQISLMDESDKYYPFYSNTFHEMITKLTKVYEPGYMWSMDLLQPDKFPEVEASGSALICFAITKAVNENLLSKNDYSLLINDCYQTLIQSLSENGKFVNVQPPNAKPESFNPDNSEPFGSGSMLFFLSEYLLYLNDSKLSDI